MNTLRLNKRVTFQSEIRTPDEGGGRSIAWTDYAQTWGSFKPERGRERVEAGRLQAALGGVLVVMSSSITKNITESFRVLIDGEPFQIRSVSNPDQQNITLEMSVEKGVAS